MNAATPQRRNAATPQRRNAATPQRRNAATPHDAAVSISMCPCVMNVFVVGWSRHVAVCAAVILSFSGCARMEIAASVQGRSSSAPDPTFGPPHKCNDHCLQRAVSIALSQMGVDPNETDSERLDNFGDILRPLQSASDRRRSTISEVTACDLLQDEALLASRKFSGVLVDLNGHIHFLIGTIDVGEQTMYQLLHGDSGIALVSKAEITAERFPKAWKLDVESDGVRLKVGSGMLLASKLNHNFGSVNPSERLTHGFTFTNIGEVPLILGNINSSCSCTTVSELADSVLMPGEEKAVTAIVVTTNVPSVRQFVSIDLTEPESNSKRLVLLSLFGSQWLFKAVTPSSIDFGVVRPGQTYSRSLSVTESAIDRYSINDVDMASAPLTWNQTESRNAQGLRVYKINFDLNVDNQPVGKETKLIRLLTDSKVSSEIAVPVSFEVAPQVSVVPSAIALGEARLAEVQQHIVCLKEIDGRPFQITLSSVPPEATVQIKNNSNAIELHVAISLKKSGLWRGTIKGDVQIGSRKESVEIKCVGVGKAS